MFHLLSKNKSVILHNFIKQKKKSRFVWYEARFSKSINYEYVNGECLGVEEKGFIFFFGCVYEETFGGVKYVTN